MNEQLNETKLIQFSSKKVVSSFVISLSTMSSDSNFNTENFVTLLQFHKTNKQRAFK